MSYTNAVVTGSNLGGVFASLANVVAIFSAGGTQFSPITFFVIAEAFLVVAFFTCLLVYRNVSSMTSLGHRSRNLQTNRSIVIHFRKREQKFFFSFQLLDERSAGDSGDGGSQTSRRSIAQYRLVLKEIWLECFNVFLTFFVSLLLFPAVQQAVQPLRSLVPALYFAPLFTFANFNLFAMLGKCNAEPFGTGQSRPITNTNTN